MRNMIFIVGLVAIAIEGAGQDLDSLLSSVEQKNLRIAAMQKFTDAEQAGLKTDIYPDNPLVTYKYLWGDNGAAGNLQEFEVVQPFRAPGYYTSKADIKKQQFLQVNLMAGMEKQEVLHNARSVYFDIVRLEQKKLLLKNLKTETGRLTEMMKAGFEAGEFSKPVYDKAQILNIKVQNDFQKTVSDIAVLREQLWQINGGSSLEKLVFQYPENWLLPQYDSLVSRVKAQNQALLMAAAGTGEAEARIRFEKKNTLPVFEAGYKSESVANQHLRGVHGGITLPLWQNSNRVKQARLKAEVSKAVYRQTENGLAAETATLYNNAQSLQNNMLQIKEVLGNEEVISGALELLQAGQISFQEYLAEVQFLLDTKLSVIEMECDYFKTLSGIKLKGGF
ncbi:MAG: outer membrane efflux [Prolixibacteraceae bacterium]|nr:MAG: outer membrane efflux [Prolixibacteraceae bacterium]